MDLRNKEEKIKIIRELVEKDDFNAIDLLIKNLKDKSKDVRLAAAQALAELVSPKARAALVEALDDTSAEVRSMVIVALGEIKSPQTIPNLVKALQDKNKNVRAKAAYVLSKFSNLTQEAILALVLALEDSSGQVRIFAAKTLKEMTLEKWKAIVRQLIIDEYNHIDNKVEQQKQNIQGEKILSIFIKALDDSEEIVREQAALVLIEIIRENKALFSNKLTAQDILIKIFEGNFSRYAHDNALRLWGIFKISKNTSIFIKILEEANSDLYDTAIEMSAEIVRENKTLAKQVIPILYKAVEDKDHNVRSFAIDALGQIAEIGDKIAIAALSKALEDEVFDVYCAALETLAKISDKQTLPALLKVLKKNKMASYYFNKYHPNKLEEIISIVENR
ncbi:MAG: HEAT repeat domain-containing protein [Acidobacteria bacterium]|nr:HEAT repeat domain-containing protein [Acidobacteriota bacterium]